MSHFVISLDFEMFWGVTDTHGVAAYGKNVEGEWAVIPRMLAMFRRHRIRASWATVGMLMCRGYAQWRAMQPTQMPVYRHPERSNYRYGELARQHPKLFFGRPLVEQILATPGQELATHTYSHFYCDEPGATAEQFAADLACAQTVAGELGVRFRSLVFPRNQVVESFLPVLENAGIHAWRGNPHHWLYRHGNQVFGGIAGRAVRRADAWLPLSGSRVAHAQTEAGLTNVPASLFLYPWTPKLDRLEWLRVRRVKSQMTAAAKKGGVFHLWWHPHNFGLHPERNLALLEDILSHYRLLHDRYGMQSAAMADFVELAWQRQQAPQSQPSRAWSMP